MTRRSVSHSRAMSIAVLAVGMLLSAAGSARAGLLSVPEKYSPDRPWPVIISYQDNPDPELMRKTDYFLLHCGGQGTFATDATRANLRALAAKYNIDPLRICGTGFSRGGHELLAQTWQHPHWFAAIAPVCNDLRKEPKVLNVKYLVGTPTLLQHGNHDAFLKTGQRVFELMKQAGCDVQFATYVGGHTPSVPFKQDVTLLTKFFDGKRLDPWPREVLHLVEHKRYSRAFWVDAILAEDAADIGATYKVTAGKDNRIAVEANEKIATLILYLNDKLVDMAKPVTVVAGDKELYNGPPARPLKVKLRDPLTPYAWKEQTPLWEELAAIRKAAAEKEPRPTSQPDAAAPAPTTQPADDALTNPLAPVRRK
ncbi:MAG: hypothetical protein BIFFINMI_03415 [Phycisphaerae bacterium]|nr:hypothetical protein [Phycisphaerae bacterium]